MTKEDKELLLKDLCGRLPYGVECEIRQREGWSPVLHDKLTCDTIKGIRDYDWYVKPYLRPMSSMTLEELEEFRRFGDHIRDDECKIHIANYEQIDWLNKNMFDYRGLIPKGLAIEVTKDNNPYKIINKS
jgi:hypothetical protein